MAVKEQGVQQRVRKRHCPAIRAAAYARSIDSRQGSFRAPDWSKGCIRIVRIAVGVIVAIARF